jgi:hypothetical protein
MCLRARSGRSAARASVNPNDRNRAVHGRGCVLTYLHPRLSAGTASGWLFGFSIVIEHVCARQPARD